MAGGLVHQDGSADGSGAQRERYNTLRSRRGQARVGEDWGAHRLPLPTALSAWDTIAFNSPNDREAASGAAPTR